MTADLKLAEQSLFERFTHALARIVHEERPEALSRPVTVAELYQDIAPYRRMRELAGIEMHADYEHALIRLLAGEGGYARLDPDSAAEALQVEAESVDPDLSAYRQFAACDVMLMFPPQAPRAQMPEAAAPPAEPVESLAAAPAAAPAPPRAPAPRPAAPGQTAREAAAEMVARATRAEAAAAQPATTSRAVPLQRAAPADAVQQAGTRCRACGEDLPTNRDVRFCPHCGGDQTTRRCVACGETLEQSWRFCIACGTAAQS